MRTLRTIAYWLRYVFRHSSVSWTLRDNDDWEYACGWETEEDDLNPEGKEPPA